MAGCCGCGVWPIIAPLVGAGLLGRAAAGSIGRGAGGVAGRFTGV
jgi:hypothetical protein